ncbi:MAG: K(+)-transporting ATPase subunit F [Gemmatimonadaceae bacterium]|nr:K(+)-transporting ATPase subunit F [Gemmatimonadaceae bacterium]
MTTESVIALALAAAIFAYLVYSLLRPERF